MTAYEVTTWLQALLRWVHVFAGILWIGQTYLFNFLERNMQRAAGAEPGHIWMVHGGGFYFLQKKSFQQPIPPELYWFKWQAAITWISGFLLFIMVYYMGGLMLDGEADLAPAVALSLGVLVLGWVVYDIVLKLGLRNEERLFMVLALLLILALHWGLSQLLSSRAAFFHIGALLGTIMTANVWLRILPVQRKILARVRAGNTPEAALLHQGPQRSRHNSYMVLPLVFIMISSHYPTISYGNEHSTIILAVIIVVGWGAAKLLRG